LIIDPELTRWGKTGLRGKVCAIETEFLSEFLNILRNAGRSQEVADTSHLAPRGIFEYLKIPEGRARALSKIFCNKATQRLI
jgi:hypothetical protein